MHKKCDGCGHMGEPLDFDEAGRRIHGWRCEKCNFYHSAVSGLHGPMPPQYQTRAARIEAAANTLLDKLAAGSPKEQTAARKALRLALESVEAPV